MRKLFSANPARIGRFEGATVTDAVPDTLARGTPGALKADLISLLGGDRVLHRSIDLVRYASDASPYRLTPQVVLLPRTIDDIVNHSVGRALDLFGLENDMVRRWGTEIGIGS